MSLPIIDTRGRTAQPPAAPKSIESPPLSEIRKRMAVLLFLLTLLPLFPLFIACYAFGPTEKDGEIYKWWYLIANVSFPVIVLGPAALGWLVAPIGYRKVEQNKHKRGISHISWNTAIWVPLAISGVLYGAALVVLVASIVTEPFIKTIADALGMRRNEARVVLGVSVGVIALALELVGAMMFESMRRRRRK